MNKKFLIENKKALIEITIAALLLVGELVWGLVYRFGGFAGIPVYSFGALVRVEYVELYTSRLFAIFINVDILYTIVVLLVNSKSEKYNRIFEIFIAILLFAVEMIVALFSIFIIDEWYIWIDRYIIRLLVIFAQIDVIYIIALLIIKSENYKLCKMVITVLIVLAEFVAIWFASIAMEVNGDGNLLSDYKAFMIILTVFTSIYVFYSVGLKVFDFVCGKRLKKDKDSAAVSAPTSD